MPVTRDRKSTTIQDVARFASVSTATVSRALSTPERVSETTRDKVNEAVRVTGYTPNQAARTLRNRASKTILVVLPDVGNTFFSVILDAVEREATARGYGILVSNRIDGQNPERKMRDYILSNRADGLLVCDGSLDLRTLTNSTDASVSMPVVIACEEHPGLPSPTVITDNADAACLGVRHLIELGHRRIGHISSPRENILFTERREGFERAMNGAGIPLREDYLFSGDFGLESGARGAHYLLKLPEPPTAIFCDNDEMAIGLISEAQNLGFYCPEDLSVCGFDDIAVAARITPPLTTLRQPRNEMGRIAAELLLDSIEKPGKASPEGRVVLKSELVVRHSTARLTNWGTG